jgi:hypothetical protein
MIWKIEIPFVVLSLDVFTILKIQQIEAVNKKQLFVKSGIIEFSSLRAIAKKLGVLLRFAVRPRRLSVS